MKKIFYFLFRRRLKRHFVALCATQLLTLDFSTKAQAPQGIPYQAIARNASGVAIANTAVKVRFSIRDSIATGAIKYQETHNPTTSALGLFSVNVGMGTVVSGTFSGISWGKNAKFLQVELNTTGGTTYTDLGTTQMMSVPYALSAASTSGLKTNNSTYGQVSVYNCDGQIQFSPCLPKVSTLSVSPLTWTSGGFVSTDGSSPVTSRGVCWSINQNPTIFDNKTVDGADTGRFASGLIGLAPGTTYFVRAYATNVAGTAYGNQESVTTSSSSVTDIDGNVYSTVQIGTQTWMRENLKVGKYRDGSAILTGYSDAQWDALITGAYTYYENNGSFNDIYGKMYNWYAVVDPRGVCPTGWHVPSQSEWNSLSNFLGGSSNAGGKLKSLSYLWESPNRATNETGFTALPGGRKLNSGSYTNLNSLGFWWTSTTSTTNAWHFWMSNSTFLSSSSNNGDKNNGFSVRCLKD